MDQRQIQELLRDAPAPMMRIDAESIVRRGRARRRRTRVATAAAALAAVALVTSVAVGWHGRDTSSVLPASTPTSTFFARGHSGLKANQVHDATFGRTGRAQADSVLTLLRHDGLLRLRASGPAKLLPLGFTVNGSFGRASILDGGSGSILLAPVPSNTTEVHLDGAGASFSSGHATTSAVLADGTHVAVIFTDRRITRHDLDGWWWTTTAGRGYYSTGEEAAVATVARTRVYYFPRAHLFGYQADRGRAQWESPPKGHLTVDGVTTVHRMRWTAVTLLPRDAAHISATVPSGYTSRRTPAVQTAALPGTPYVVAGLSLTSHREDGPVSHGLRISWVDAHGGRHVVR